MMMRFQMPGVGAAIVLGGYVRGALSAYEVESPDAEAIKPDEAIVSVKRHDESAAEEHVKDLVLEESRVGGKDAKSLAEINAEQYSEDNLQLGGILNDGLGSGKEGTQARTECSKDEHCNPAKPRCLDSGICDVECKSDKTCKNLYSGFPYCVDFVCEECNNNTHCARSSKGTLCEEHHCKCINDEHCESSTSKGKFCVNHQCKECKKNKDCPGAQKHCNWNNCEDGGMLGGRA